MTESDFPDSGNTAVHDFSAVREQLAAGKSAADRHLLVRMSGSSVGQVIVLEDARRLGRAPDSDVWLHDDDVSRRHASIERDGEGFAIADLGSVNGTFVNAERVTERRRLEDGDLVQLGPAAVFRYHVTDREHEQMMCSLYEATVRDALTGAFNREHLDERLRAEVSFARRHQTEVGLVMLDLDRFKAVNDTYGHPTGDDVLVATVRAVLGGIRLEDMLARYGGEEFALVLRDTPLAGVARVAERLRAIVASLTVVARGGGVVRPTASLGCATLSCCAERTAEALVEVADRRLLEAKRRGRNCIVAEG